jgi:hypothetical protein
VLTDGQLEDIEILYEFHFDSLPKNEHETRTRLITLFGVPEISK